MTKTLRIFAALLLGVLLASCDVHELPKGDAYVDVTLTVKFDDDLPLYRELDYTTKAEGQNVQMRHTIRAFRANGVNRYSTEPAVEKVVYTGGVQDVTVDLRLEPVDYKIMVWSDYADEAGKALFYDAADFGSVRILEGEYKGSNPYRDAFSGTKELALTEILEASAHIEETLQMTRPVGKFSIISVDRDEFLKMFMARLVERYKNQASVGPIYSKAEDIDVNIFKVVVAYNGFLPDTWSLWTGRPIDARTGVQFNSRLRELEGGDLELAFDYVLVNGEESSVNVNVYIFDDLGDILSVMHSDVPLHAGMRTVLTGRFLTSGAASGVSIKPGYDGEYNIQL